jgi:hypothetical protein
MKMFALQKKVCASEKCWCKSKKVHFSQKMLAQTKKICASQKIFAQTKKVRTSQKMFAQTTKGSSLQILAFSRNVGASRNMQRIHLFGAVCPSSDGFAFRFAWQSPTVTGFSSAPLPLVVLLL